ncbi:MAG: CapA family protein [Gemmatimonadetes bacterium]|nr:CapA family protein [Gemmatimonadota bacterium]
MRVRPYGGEDETRRDEPKHRRRFALGLSDWDSPPPGHLDAGIVGDVLLTDTLWTAAGPQVTADLRSACWTRLAGCSIVLANLEAPISSVPKPADRKPYNFRTDVRALDLFDQRFVLSLANNHIMDYGAQGLVDTLEVLDRAGLSYAGAGTTLDRARAPHYRSVTGIETAILCAADPRFQAATASTPGTCPARPGLLAESVTEARRRARFVAVAIHMGMEHSTTPSTRQIDLAEECLDAGARFVAFHHAHRIGGYSTSGRGIVLWGTGNYVFADGNERPRGKTARTAAWRVRYSQPADAVTALSIEPAVIDRAGVPRTPDAGEAARERERIHGLGSRVRTPLRRTMWHSLEMLEPEFVRSNVTNYARLLRLRGLSYVWRSLVAGLRAQLTR